MTRPYVEAVTYPIRLDILYWSDGGLRALLAVVDLEQSLGEEFSVVSLVVAELELVWTPVVQ